MAKNFLSSSSLLPFLSGASLAFSRLYEQKLKSEAFEEGEEEIYANVEECLRAGVKEVDKEASLFSGYLSFAKGALSHAKTEEAAVLGYLAYECALTFKGKATVAGKDWADGFLKAVEKLKAFYDGPLAEFDESLVKRFLFEKPTSLEDVASMFMSLDAPKGKEKVLHAFLYCQAEGFLHPSKETPAPLEEIPPFSNGKDGYRMKFVLQILNRKIERTPFVYEDYVASLESNAEDVECKKQGTRVIVNLVTLDPSRILSLSQQYGEFVSFQMDNAYLAAQDSHPVISSKKSEIEKGRAVVAVTISESMSELFQKLGAHVTVDHSKSSGVSVDDILTAFKRIPSGDIIFLPDSQKLFVLGKIAGKLLGDRNVIVLPSSSPQECYFALSNALFEDEAIDDLIASLMNGIESIASLSAKKNELLSVLRAYETIEDAEFCFIFCGKKASEDEIAEARASLEEDNPYLEIGEIEIGQKSPDYLIGVSK